MNKKIILSLMLVLAVVRTAMAQETYSGTVVANEGAWCWFADPRALHYSNEAGTINATYIGYIDVHGNVKATQYDWIKGRKTDILIRSYFQPDDHNNPTFVVLPDERVMIFYTRHTDEAKIWYRISKKPGDISALGDEKYLATANNTTYPSPFILSDDPNHIYLCWRGINWHPTLARLTMPDANDDCKFDFGPKQIVQSTGARPYAKYQSNGKDKIYVSYTTGHPDNEMPDWLYFNVIDINKGNGPILRDLNGKQLSIVNNGVFNVNKTTNYASSYPATIVDNTSNIRNWVWQITLDANENPVIAYPHIDDAKTTHVYWYARWTGSEWRRTWVQYGGHAFHQNWNSTERCYSGGMAVDPDNINDLYLSIPTKDGVYNKDGVYEIWKYTIDDTGKVAGSEQITQNSVKNNVRPFVIPGSKNSPMRLAWMNGDYYYWIVKQGYPKGYPTDIRVHYEWEEEERTIFPVSYTTSLGGTNQTLNMVFSMDPDHYEGDLFWAANGSMKYTINATTKRPELTINGTTYTSQNSLYTSDDWATLSNGTSGDNHPTKIGTWALTITYDGHTITTYRNGLVDQVIEDIEDLYTGAIACEGEFFSHECLTISAYKFCATPTEVQKLVSQSLLSIISLPFETRTDLVLPNKLFGKEISWASSDEEIITPTGIVHFPDTETEVKLTATIDGQTRDFFVKVYPRNITKNLRYALLSPLDLTSNTASGFSTNSYGLAPEGLLTGLRSYTVLLTATPKTMTKQPRLYDFGSGSGNSLFLRADALSAGIKYNGGATTMVTSSTKLQAGTEYVMAVTYNAATKTTTIYINGQEDVSGTANQNEPYMLAEIATDNRNFIGRTQWWDGTYAADNQDFCGTISNLRLYDVCLTRREICELQGLPYEQKELPSALANGDFEDTYSVMSGSGVSSDRAIYLPKGWTIDYVNRNENDLTALKSGDYYFSNFFGNNAKSSPSSKQTYWIRQNWGTSTLTLSQELRLPAGSYTLNMDLWKSGLGGDAVISVVTEGKTPISAPTLANQEAWQPVSLDFESDGEASTTISLSAVHTSSGNSKIIGFDNVVINTRVPDAMRGIKDQEMASESRWYDLGGRAVDINHASQGVYVNKGQKRVVRR